LALNDGATAIYQTGSGTTALSFTYTVGALGSGQNTSDLALAASNAVSLNGATIQDPFGNAADLSAVDGYNPAGTLIINTTQPVLSVTGIVPDTGTSATDGLTNIANVTVTGTIDVADASRPVSVYDGATLVGTTTADSSGNWRLAGVTLAQGANSLTAQATNAEGNAATSPVFTATLDTTAPVLSVTGVVPENASTATIAGTIDVADAGLTVSVYDGTTLVGTTSADASGIWSLAGVPLTENDNLIAKATDAAGNIGISKYVTINSGSEQNVYVGRTASGMTINTGGAQVVWGTASGTTINGGDQYVYGMATDTTVSTGAQVIYSGGTGSATTLNSGGEQYVFSGGTAIGSTIAGGKQYDWGTATTTTVGNNGYQHVYGTANGTTVNSGGGQNVYSSGTASGTTVNEGGQQIDWGTAAGTMIDGGNQYVYGVASSTTIATGEQVLESGGTASGTTISSGGEQVIYTGATASDTTIAGGVQDDWGTAGGTTVDNGGYQYVHGTAGPTTIDSGGEQNVYFGGTASGTMIDGGSQYVWGTAANTTISAGAQVIESGGLASGTTIGSGGEQDVYGGGTASSTTISGGLEHVYAGGTAQDAAFGGSSGTLVLDSSSGFAGAISNFRAGDIVDLAYIHFSNAGMTLDFSEDATNTSGTLTISDGSNVATLDLLGQYSAAQFALSADGHGGTLVTDPPITGSAQNAIAASPHA
jgi:autotransporter passenger strand-loop-strand repeat protein